MLATLLILYTHSVRNFLLLSQVWVWEGEQLVRVVLAQPPREVILQQEAIADTLSRVAAGTAVVDEVRYHVRDDNTVNTNWWGRKQGCCEADSLYLLNIVLGWICCSSY